MSKLSSKKSPDPVVPSVFWGRLLSACCFHSLLWRCLLGKGQGHE